MIGLFHAYRAANRGDGWLVQLASDVIVDAVGAAPITYALDGTNMPGEVRTVLERARPISAGLAAGLNFIPRTERLVRPIVGLPSAEEVDFGVGVGGAYLRSNDRVHELVLRSHQLPQLQLMAELGERAAYLPVSIGPFRPGLSRTVEQCLRRIGFVAVRDDVSYRELGHLPNVHRLPDLAVLSVGDSRPALAERERGVVAFAIRSLAGTDLGVAAASALRDRGQDVRFGVQSSVGRTNDDTKLYESAGVLDGALPLDELLRSDPAPSVVVAGRLHAALHSIAAGYPTIHLGYERKSWGAYADLGLDRWVVNAWSTPVDELVDLVLSLERDPQPYWDALSARFDDLAAARQTLVEAVARAAGRQPVPTST